MISGQFCPAVKNLAHAESNGLDISTGALLEQEIDDLLIERYRTAAELKQAA